jgi:hypothetical protein
MPNAEVRFNRGLNVISGPSDTGKTFIVQCIDYMLGGSKVPKPIPESERYETVRLGLQGADSEPEIVFERSIRGGDFNLHEVGQAERILKSKHQADEEGNISHYLLGISGLTSRRVRTNKEGKTRDVSFRDLARLILVDEEAIIRETSPIHSGQYTSATAESAVFRLLLTGVDDSSLTAKEDPKTAKGRNAGKAEMLELLLNRTRGRMAELQLPGDQTVWREELNQIEALYDAAEKELAAEQESAAQFEQRRRIVSTQLRKIESRADVLTELQHRFELLEQQYLSDLRRLESIAEAGFRLGEMQEERCFVCGALAEHQEHDHQKPDAAPEDVAHACLAEAIKIKTLLADLRQTRSENDRQVLRLRAQGKDSSNELAAISKKLDEHLKPRIEIALQRFRDSQSKRDVYRRALELSGQVEELQGLLNEIEGSKAAKGLVLASAKIRTDEADGFSKEVESLLRTWHFPNLDRVTFSEGDQDVVISGRKRASHGKGVRAIAHAAFNLGLLNYSIRRSMPHPGLVLIDSPLVVYREPDTDEGGFPRDVKDSFYRSTAKESRNSQVIIFENEDPPTDMEQSANVIRFTGAGYGRRGFIPACE